MSAMKWASFVLAIIVVSAIVINGQKKSPQAAPNQHRANGVRQAEVPASHTIVVNQEAPNAQENRAKDHAESYLSRLFSPENLPSIGLLGAGIFGIITALRTLGAIKRQADLMEGGLHVDGIRVIEFQEGRQPIFFVKIMNSGTIAAKNVSVSMKIELADSTTEYLHDQVMIIPARDGRECFIRSGIMLKEGDLLKLERSDMILRVSGHVARQKYCYKYNPWPFDKRPPELPCFVACDFDTRIAVGATAKVTGVSAVASVGTATARAETSDTKASKEPTEPD